MAENIIKATELINSIKLPNNLEYDDLGNLSERVTVLKSELQQLNDRINTVVVNTSSGAVEDHCWSLAELNAKLQAISATGTDISSQQYILNLSDLSSTVILNLDSTNTSTTYSYDRSSASTLGFNKVDITFNVNTSTAVSSAVSINIDESISSFTANTTDNITTYSTQIKPEESKLGIEQVDVDFNLESTSIILTPDNMSETFQPTKGIGFKDIAVVPELAELTITADNFVVGLPGELLASDHNKLGYSKVTLPGKATDVNHEINLALSDYTIENATIISTAIQSSKFNLTHTVNSSSVLFDATSENNNNFIGPDKIIIKNPDYIDVTLNSQAELIRVISSNSNLEQQYKTFQFLDDFACVRSFSVPKIPILEQCIIDADIIRNNIKSGNSSYTYSIDSAYTNQIQINLPNLATLSSNDSTYLEYLDTNNGLVTVGIEAAGINDYYNNPITTVNVYQYTANDAEATNETTADRYTSCTLIDSTVSTVLQHTTDVIDTYNFNNTQYQLYSFLHNPLQKHRVEFTIDASATTEVEFYRLVQIDNTTTKTKLFTFKTPEVISIDHINKKITVDSIQTYTFIVDSIAGFYSSMEPIADSMLFDTKVYSTGIKCIISTGNEESVELADQDLYALLTDMPNIEDLSTLEGLFADSIITSHYYIVTNRSNLIEADIPTNTELQDIILAQTPKSLSYAKDDNGLLINEIVLTGTNKKCLYVPLDIFQTDENGTLLLDEYGNPKLIVEETKISIPKSFSDTLSDGTKINYTIDSNSIKSLANPQAVICQAEVSIELIDNTDYVIDEIDKQVEVLFYTQAGADSDIIKMKYYQPAIQIINNETEI